MRWSRPTLLSANIVHRGSPRYAYELNLPDLRSRPLTRYPHQVFSIEQEGHIDVWRVLHSQRDIPAWMLQPDES
jgi:toxin ParE1/3/4